MTCGGILSSSLESSYKPVNESETRAITKWTPFISTLVAAVAVAAWMITKSSGRLRMKAMPSWPHLKVIDPNCAGQSLLLVFPESTRAFRNRLVDEGRHLKGRGTPFKCVLTFLPSRGAGPRVKMTKELDPQTI